MIKIKTTENTEIWVNPDEISTVDVSRDNNDDIDCLTVHIVDGTSHEVSRPKDIKRVMAYVNNKPAS